MDIVIYNKIASLFTVLTACLYFPQAFLVKQQCTLPVHVLGSKTFSQQDFSLHVHRTLPVSNCDLP